MPVHAATMLLLMQLLSGHMSESLLNKYCFDKGESCGATLQLVQAT